MQDPRFTLPPLAQLRERARVVALPLNTRFRGVETREMMLFEGPQGWAEWSPFVEYDAGEAAMWLRAALAQGWQEPVAALRESVPVNITVPAVAAAVVPDVLARYGEVSGVQAVKVKVAQHGQTIDDDVARVAAVREALGDVVALRVDANAAWDPTAARTAISALQPYQIDYFEQPVATLREMHELRSFLGAPIHDLTLVDRGRPRIAADEALRKAVNHFGPELHAQLREVADVLVVKQAPLGGVARALKVVQAVGIPAVVSSALDSSVGLGAGVRLAAALPAELFAGPCGLATGSLLAGDVTRRPVLQEHGELRVATAPVDVEMVEHHRGQVSRETWWMDRLADAYAQLERDLDLA